MFMNVKFDYLYRDTGNYKLYGTSILTNRHDIPIDELERQTCNSFIDKVYFDPVKCNIPKLEFPEIDEELDHDWHEFLAISSTEEVPDLNLDILEFIQLSIIAHLKAFP